MAQSGMKITVDDVLNSPKIVDPFKRLDNCLYTEGAACVILASKRAVKKMKLRQQPIWITGIGAALDWVFPGNRPNIHQFHGCRKAARDAYKMAGIKDPVKELDLAELHDAFSGTEIMAYEDCFFCEEGEGGRLIDDGTVMAGGRLPVNLSGGLIGCGHAVGATGLMQTAEVVQHLRGQAGERQLKNARKGLIQSIGGTLCSWTVVAVFEKEG
jgi:acetyl-CoA acetyltransferase